MLRRPLWLMLLLTVLTAAFLRHERGVALAFFGGPSDPTAYALFDSPMHEAPVAGEAETDALSNLSETRLWLRESVRAVAPVESRRFPSELASPRLGEPRGPPSV